MPKTKDSEWWVEELLRRLIDHGPLWYRGSMPEAGQATMIIDNWLVEWAMYICKNIRVQPDGRERQKKSLDSPDEK